MISHKKFVEIHKKGYNLDILYLLQNVEYLESLSAESSKIAALVNTSIRKGLLTDDLKLTLEGQKLYEYSYSATDTEKFVKPKIKVDDFEKWWKAFPGTDNFEYKNRKFVGTRALRVKKEDCKEKIAKILNEGEYSIDDLIGALNVEIQQKMEASIKDNKNKLSYMQNSHTYLNQRSFEPFIELYKKSKPQQSNALMGGVDI